MRHFNISYTSYYNWKHNRRGHLYQGRYKSFLVDGDNYLQEVSRYIHLNPVRVRLRSGMGMDEKKKYLRNYDWSSYGDYLSRDGRSDFVRVEEVLGYLGGDTGKGRRKYLGSGASSRELPAVRKILAQVEPERIMGAICEAFKAKREELLTKGYKGPGRGY